MKPSCKIAVSKEWSLEIKSYYYYYYYYYYDDDDDDDDDDFVFLILVNVLPC